jgi:hypothetical protein
MFCRRSHAVLGAEQAGADAAEGTPAVVADVVPHRRVDDLRVLRVDGDVDGAGRSVRRREHDLPRLAAVGRAVQASVMHAARDVARCRREDPLRVRGIDRDAADRRAVGETHVRPVGAVVGGLVDAVAEVGQAAAGRVGLTRADPQVAVGRLGHRAHRLCQVVVPQVGPVAAAVGGLPDAAARHGREGAVGSGMIGHHVDDAAAHVVRAHLVPSEAVGGCRDVGGLRLLAPDHRRGHRVVRALLEVHQLVRRRLVRQRRLVLRSDDRLAEIDLRCHRRRARERHCRDRGEQRERAQRERRDPYPGPPFGPPAGTPGPVTA